MLAGFLPLSPDNDDRHIGGKPGEGSGEGGDVLSDVDDMATVPELPALEVDNAHDRAASRDEHLLRLAEA